VSMPDSEKLVRLEQRGQVAWLVIDSPANRNALGGPVLDGLVSGLKEALGSPEVRVIVVTGTGHVFSSGADLRDTTDLAVIEQAYRDLFRGIADAGKPIVARINGHCFGGAIGLASTKRSLPSTRSGWGGPQHWRRSCRCPGCAPLTVLTFFCGETASMAPAPPISVS
jgi:enoyl-CoA hydratase/carnithine racemase